MRRYLLASVVALACIAFFVQGTSASDPTCDNHYSECPAPIPLGVSGGNINDMSRLYCCGGTLGALVQDANGSYILSNNHVLARTNRGAPGEDIIQPGLIDASPVCSQNPFATVANLTRFVPISFKKRTNTVDAAIAEVVNGSVDPEGYILDIGMVGPETTPAAVGLGVMKSGRTTGLTTGTVIAVGVNAKIAYNKECGVGSQTATFVNQILIGPGDFSDGGDSGSLIVAADTESPVGLLFAGSSAYTLANPIDDVLESLCVAMVGSTVFPDPSACAAGGGSGGGGGPPPGKGPKPKKLPAGLEVASEVRARHEAQLLAIRGVVGTGLSFNAAGRPVIEVYVVPATPQVERQIPGNLDGVSVRVVQTGQFRAR